MELIRKIFVNKRTGQMTLSLPKKKILKEMEFDKIPKQVKVKISPILKTKDKLIKL